jgi:DNA-binding transcriptional ArsR family regulator
MASTLTAPERAPLANSRDRLELAAKFFRGFADPVRLAILRALADGEYSVEEICNQLACKQPRVSNHLAYLRWCGFVQNRRDGNRVYYSIKNPAVLRILNLADEAISAHADWMSAMARI